MKTDYAIDWRKSAAEIQADFEAVCKQRDELLAAANQCRLDLLHQIHELADHIERANYCIIDPDMLSQINGQSKFAMSVAAKWNQNGNPFAAIASVKSYGQPEKTAETCVPATASFPSGSLGEEVES